MKAFGTAAALATILAVMTPLGAAAAEAKQDFVLLNKTGFEIKAVFVSPTRSNKWEEDVMGDDTLEEDASVKIHFASKTKTCIYDMKVVYAIDDSNAVWKNIDLCKIAKVTIYYNKKNDTTRAVFD